MSYKVEKFYIQGTEGHDFTFEVSNEKGAYVATFGKKFEKDAKLFAASPDLLEALQKAKSRLQFADKHIDCSEEIAICNAAIAKATGETK
jgi:hypothetical protein